MLKAILNFKNAQELSKKEQANLTGGKNNMMCAPVSVDRPCICLDNPGCGYKPGQTCPNGSNPIC